MCSSVSGWAVSSSSIIFFTLRFNIRSGVPPPDGPEGHNSLEDAAEEATRELQKQRDGKGYAGFGDIG